MSTIWKTLRRQIVYRSVRFAGKPGYFTGASDFQILSGLSGLLMILQFASLSDFRFPLLPARSFVRPVVILCILTSLATIAVAPTLARWEIPAAALGCAIYLYRQDKCAYLSFVWWLYFLSPCLKRVVDYKAGVDPTQAVSATSLLCTCVGMVGLVSLIDINKYRLWVLVLSCCAAYGAILSIFSGASLFVAAEYFLLSLAPASVGLLVANHWRMYLRLSQTVQTTFIWGLLFTGAYGVVQYLHPLPWDVFWMENYKEDIASFGIPEPMGIRVFSTMGGPQPFALTVVLGLCMIIASRQSKLKYAALSAGSVGLLLSLSRGAWLECVVALAVYGILSRSRGVLLSLVVAPFVLGSLVLYSATPLADEMTTRIDSIRNIDGDTSKLDRIAAAEEALNSGIRAPLGLGWEIESERPNVVHDNTAIEALRGTGWAGLLSFYFALCGVLVMLLCSGAYKRDRFASAVCAFLIASVVESVSNSFLFGLGGMIVWTGCGLAICAIRHNAEGNRFEAVDDRGHGWARLII